MYGRNEITVTKYKNDERNKYVYFFEIIYVFIVTEAINLF